MTRSKLAAMLLAAIAVGGAAPALFAQGGTAQGEAVGRPWMNKVLSPDKRADLLLAQMSLDEKVALLHGPMAMPFGPFTLPDGAIGSAGYIAGNARLGIPALQESDASLGVNNPGLVRGVKDMSTALPSGLALAATFNPQIAFEGGQMVGSEARAKGLNVQLAGGVNLARDPRNGRNFEYVGEDPLLAGLLTGASINGIQSMGVVSTIKHFALNGQELNRMTADSVIGDAAARESDLLAFQIAIEKSDPGSVMCAYNLVNGHYACENDWLLNTVLKRDWGYKGFVMSDWGAVHSVQSIVNGLDQQSGEQIDLQVWFDKPLKQAVAEGKVPQARVDEAARRILRTMFAHGLFDQTAAKPDIDFAAHALVAQREAEEAIVLLENRKGLLPLAATGKRIAVIGGHAEAGVASGAGSSQVNNPYHVAPQTLRSVPFGGEGIMASINNVLFHPSPPLAALRTRFGDANVSYDTGFYAKSAAAAAKAADIAIVFVYQPSSEGYDVPDMSLPLGQDAIVEAVAAANPNTIVVLQTGNPVAMPWANKVGAIVQAWYSGSKGGDAIARVLTGEVNPSGRLPISWPANEQQLPRPVIPGTGSKITDRVTVDYRIEGSDVGYRWFARQKQAPLYWFGHGLSYTRFGYDKLSVSGGKTLTAKVVVTNRGDKRGKDVVQLYLTDKPGGAARRLLAFQKVDLAPGESREVTLVADPRLLADYDEKRPGWRIGAGRYGVGIGTDAGTMTLSGGVTLRAMTLKP